MPCSNGTYYLCVSSRSPHLSKLSANRRSMSSVYTVSRAPSALSSLSSAVAPSARRMLNSSQLSQLLPIHFCNRSEGARRYAATGRGTVSVVG